MQQTIAENTTALRGNANANTLPEMKHFKKKKKKKKKKQHMKKKKKHATLNKKKNK